MLDIPFSDKVECCGVASLDRIDSSQGYIKGNVQWVHKDINKMKFDLSQDRFLELCNIIVQNRG